MSEQATTEQVIKGFTCNCGAFVKFPAYVYAQWGFTLNYTHDCGRKYHVLEGEAEMIGWDNHPAPPAEQEDTE